MLFGVLGYVGMDYSDSWRSFRRTHKALLDWHSMNRFVLLTMALSLGACSSRQSTVESVSTQRLDPAAASAGKDDASSKPAPDTSEIHLQGEQHENVQRNQTDRWRPYFDIAPLDTALEAFHAGRNREAARLFEGYILEQKEGPRILPARFLSLLAWHDAGVSDPTAKDLETLAETWPLLGDYALYYAGSCHERAGRNKEALSAFEKVEPASSLRARAVEKRARILARTERLDDALTLLKALTLTEKRGRQESWLLRAQLLKRAGKEADARRAATEAVHRNPLSQSGKAAARLLDLDGGLSARDQLRLGKVYMKQQLHPRALKALKAAADRFPRASKSRCEALLGIGKTYEKMKQRKKAWTLYNRALGCRGESRALATFWGGRNRLRAGALEESERLLKAHLKEFPHRSTADDTHILLASVARKKGDLATAERLLFESIRNYPKGDMADETVWDLLWPLIKAKKYRAADRMATRLLRIPRRETRSGSEGRLSYWAGWVYLKRKKNDEAKLQFQKVITEHPLSWYALLAGERLRRLDGQSFDIQLAEQQEAAHQEEDALGDDPQAMETDEHFLKARELSRMGLHRSAKRELDFIGEDKPVEARRWAKARLFSAGKFFARASGLARPAVKRINDRWPTHKAADLWKLAYPKAFEQEVLKWARTRDIDPMWVWAIMRTESNFNPTVKSWAGAHGLMQIMPATAKNLARGTGIKVSKSALKDPNVSLELGTKYLAKLKRRNPVLACASAAYNAGGGAMKKWRKKFGGLPLDEFVETMPYNEARRYAKKVLSTMAVYRWLYDGKTTRLSLAAPGVP